MAGEDDLGRMAGDGPAGDGALGRLDPVRLRSLFRKFVSIARLDPWRWLEPRDYFGIMPAGSVEPVFFHFTRIGNADELVLAFGWDACATFRQAVAGTLDHGVMRLYEHPLVRCRMKKRTEMSSVERTCADIAALPSREDGLSPVFTCYRPGWLPWTLLGADLPLCENLLDQALGVLLRAEADPALVRRADPSSVWVRFCDGNGAWQEDWRPLGPFHQLLPGPDSKVPEDLVRKAASLPVTMDVVELDLDILPYFPFLKPEDLSNFQNGLVPLSYFLAMCDGGPDVRPDKSCIANCIIYSGGDIPRMWNAMAASVLEFFVEAGGRPREIGVSSKRMMDFMRPLQTRIRFKLTYHQSLPNYEAVLARSAAMIHKTLADREAARRGERQEEQ